MTTEPLDPLPGNPSPPGSPQRRVAVLPVVLAVVALLVAVVFAVVIVGLATTGGPASAPPPAVAPTGEALAPAPPAPETDPRPAAGMNECVDALGDGAVDLDSARVAVENGRLQASITLAAALPSDETTIGIYAVSGDGETIMQLASTWRDGELDDFFVQRYGVGENDDNRGRGKDDDDEVDVDDLDSDDADWDGTTLAAEFPRSIARELGDDWRWYAFAAVDGTEVDACPGAAQTFETQEFDSE